MINRLMIMEIWFGEKSVFFDRMKLWESDLVINDDGEIEISPEIRGNDAYWAKQELADIKKSYYSHWVNDTLVLYKTNATHERTRRAIEYYVNGGKIKSIRPNDWSRRK